MSAEQRQAVKQQATQTALLDNNAAAALATAAAAVALFSPPHAAALGVGSGLFWLCANYRQSIANDPPRDDFGDVWMTTAQLDEAQLPGEESRERLLYRFDAQQLLACDGLYALLRSLERYDGAVAVGDIDAANSQAEAVRHNGETAATHQDTLIGLALEVNSAWASLRDELGVDWNAVSLADVQQFYRDTVGESPQEPGPALEALAASVVDGASDLLEPFDTGLDHPVLAPNELPDEPQELLGQGYIDGWSSMSAAMRSLVVDA
ncbi:hypothetical protein NFX46_20340 [Streptomyces phaeoluteigriseus]|uniref:Uncharacterized protein n=1 Tax=Streptomyces phaeoluteigriseus TaxID=114686 RepID=A0ABY4ZB17_9ACTN|nr:hypothetical protein [Streptomyces phaeoluteigriseus]USQ85875.1 hypothetical protein NFX46_20340 [Streptomyces phaeoluteigriseus]